jgi:hypothetical protein
VVIIVVVPDPDPDPVSAVLFRGEPDGEWQS